jgi:hypothetical protein
VALEHWGAYARHLRLSLKAVKKALHAGRIRATPEGKIEVEQADRDWSHNTGPRPAAALDWRWRKENSSRS